MYVCARLAQLCLTIRDTMHCSPPDSSVHWDSPGKNTAMGGRSLFHLIFPTQGSDLHSMASAVADKFFTTSTNWES